MTNSTALSSPNLAITGYMSVSPPQLPRTNVVYTIINNLPWEIYVYRKTTHGTDAYFASLPPKAMSEITRTDLREGDILIVKDKQGNLLTQPQVISYIHPNNIRNGKLRITICNYLYDPLPTDMGTYKMSSVPEGVAGIKILNSFMFPIDIKLRGNVIARCEGYDTPGLGSSSSSSLGGSRSIVYCDNQWEGFRKGDRLEIWRRDTGTFLFNLTIDDTYSRDYYVGKIVTHI